MNQQNFKICIVSTSRADFGLLSPLLKELHEDPEIELQFLVSGSHVGDKHGSTLHEVKETKFPIKRIIDIGINNDTKLAIGHTISRSVDEFTIVFNEILPDVVVVLGDRYEMFGVATAAMSLNIPIAHLHGGELTEGAIDDAMRHAITKMADLHFVCAEAYRKRVVQLGEQPDRVFNFGALGVDQIVNIKKMSQLELEENLDLKFGKHNIMVGYHSVTLDDNSDDEFDVLLGDLRQLDDIRIIFTMPNADFGGQVIKEKMISFCENKPNVSLFENLGSRRYLSCLSNSDILIGNSSSGILEAPYMGCYTINIGARQDGRLRAETVTDVSTKPGMILNEIHSILGKIDSNGRPKVDPIFGKGGAGKAIAKTIKEQIPSLTKNKKFYDISFKTPEKSVVRKSNK